jgi:hypothetical protein
MVFAHHSFEYPYIFGIADLNEQVSTPHFDVTLKHVVAILSRPYQVRRQSGDGMMTVSVLFHATALLAFPEVCSN